MRESDGGPGPGASRIADRLNSARLSNFVKLAMGLAILSLQACSGGSTAEESMTPEQQLISFLGKACLRGSDNLEAFDRLVQSSSFFRAADPNTRHFRRPHHSQWVTPFGSASLRKDVVDFFEVRTCTVSVSYEEGRSYDSQALEAQLARVFNGVRSQKLRSGDLSDPPQGFTRCGMVSDYSACWQVVPAPYSYWRSTRGFTGDRLVVLKGTETSRNSSPYFMRLDSQVSLSSIYHTITG